MTATTEPGIVIAFRNDRLGARLNTLLTAMRISQTYGARLRIYWRPEDTDGLDRPEDLFSQAFIDEHFVTRQESREIMDGATDVHAMSRKVVRDEFVEAIGNGKNFLAQTATQQTVLPWESREVLTDLPVLLGQIGLSPYVQKMLDLIDKRLEGLSFSSYHFRRGDIIDDNLRASHSLWPTKYIPRIIYERHIERKLAEDDGLLVVFSDTKPEADAFVALSPRVKSFSDLVGDQELAPLQRDFLELYTMSRSEQIFAPPNSAFSGIAAVIGNKKVTDITRNLSREDYAAAMDELAERLETRPEIFLTQSDRGQNIPFIVKHLEGKGEGARATALVLGQIRQGLDRAYAYPIATRRLLADMDYEGCRNLVKSMVGNPALREGDISICYQHTAQAAMINEEWGGANEYFHTGCWLAPFNRLTTENMWLLYSLNRLELDSYFPLDPDLMLPARRDLQRLQFSERQILIQRLVDKDAPYLNYPHNIDTRDWWRQSGKFPMSRLNDATHNRRRAEMTIEEMQRLRIDKPAWQGMLGILWRDAGEMDLARTHLQQALDAQPEKSLYHKRMADLLLAEGRAEEAIPILERALAMSGGLAPYAAALAAAYREIRENARYIKILTDLRHVDTPLIEIRLSIAEAMLRDPESVAELPAYLEDLLRRTGESYRVWLLWVKAGIRLGHWDAALAGIRAIHKLGRPSEKAVHKMLNNLFKSYCEAHDEAQTRSWFAEHGIDIDSLELQDAA